MACFSAIPASGVSFAPLLKGKKKASQGQGLRLNVFLMEALMAREGKQMVEGGQLRRKPRLLGGGFHR